MRPVFSFCLALGMATTAAPARGGEPALELPTDPQSGVQPAGCHACTKVPSYARMEDTSAGRVFPPKPSCRERLRIACWIQSNCNCEDCGTLCSELRFVLGSCGSFNCGE